ncbi:hypothetical protein [Haloferax volcanii]|uniref:hypothetical protein n=1 Tax=Haloferax volcanii TaxID=2246 RepID=UPI0009D9CE85|nr:hypothetical protein [Haloferax alexandrinus]
MTHDQSTFDRRTVLRTAAVLSAGLAGCLNGSTETGDGTTTPNDDSDEQGILRQVAVEGTELGVELGSEADVDRVNLIQPNGELFGTREVAAGVRQVSFEIGTAYDPGEYRILAVQGEETVAETSLEIRPQLEIVDVGLFRNNPDKPWDEVYGESETNRIQNSQASVSVRNLGTGAEAVLSLRFSGDVPNPIEKPRNHGLYDADEITVPAGESRDLYSSSLPFSEQFGDDGMGCSIERNTGEFSVLVGTRVSDGEVSHRFGIEYSGSDTVSDCNITITKA